jgi:hypothetical protein
MDVFYVILVRILLTAEGMFIWDRILLALSVLLWTGPFVLANEEAI